ncbi:MAG TPA: hypothetical protein VI757_09930 [Bacteroidia bacterium]|nr:hypothetical protein [Bacteroidia bacterium]
MKKLAILFSVIFVYGIISASAQSSAAAESNDVKTEAVKSDDGAKAKSKSCCGISMKGCKADSKKCCSKEKAEKSCPESTAKSEAAIRERKENASAPDGSK